MRFALITVVTLVLAIVTAQLGLWQLSRAQEKRARHAQMLRLQTLPALEAPEFLRAAQEADVSPLLYRRVHLRGQWVDGATVYLENRQMQGKPGFFVYTPLRLAQEQGVVAVLRGWAARDFNDRTRLPQLATSGQEVELFGEVAGEPARLFEFATAEVPEGASPVRQNLSLAEYAHATGLALLPVSVVQTGRGDEGLQRDWAAVDDGVPKHYGYAFQWFGLCGLVTILYVWFQIVRRFAPSRSAPHA